MSQELIDQFSTKYASLSGIPHVVDGADDVVGVVMHVLQEANGKRVALSELPDAVASGIASACSETGIEVLQPPFDNQALPHLIDAAEVGVSWAAFAVAESGSLVEFSTNDATRLVSTLPRIHIGLVKASDILATLKAAAQPLRQFYVDNPENATATFISGPSRTADIEMRLTLGVHGPEVAHTVIVKGL